MWQLFILYKLSAELGAMNCLFPQKFRFLFTRLEMGARKTPGQRMLRLHCLSSRFLPPPSALLCPALPKGLARGQPTRQRRETGVKLRENWGATEIWNVCFYIYLYFPK